MRKPGQHFPEKVAMESVVVVRSKPLWLLLLEYARSTGTFDGKNKNQANITDLSVSTGDSRPLFTATLHEHIELVRDDPPTTPSMKMWYGKPFLGVSVPHFQTSWSSSNLTQRSYYLCWELVTSTKAFNQPVVDTTHTEWPQHASLNAKSSAGSVVYSRVIQAAKNWVLTNCSVHFTTVQRLRLAPRASSSLPDTKRVTWQNELPISDNPFAA